MLFDVRTVDTTSSTNDAVRALAREGAGEGLVVRALEQSSGKGRQGRAWTSPRGNLYFSVLLRPRVPLSAWWGYSFVAALAIGEAIEFLVTGARVELKWPNDVLVNGKKVSGILLEAGDDWLVVGMGINIAVVPEAPLYPVTSLGAEGCAASPEDVLQKILAAFDGWCTRLEREGFAPVREAWRARARKGKMRVRLPDGEELSGLYVDLDKTGTLRLCLDDGCERTVYAGDVLMG